MNSKKIELSEKNLFVCENKKDGCKIFDGNPRTKWSGGQYPTFVEIDLEKSYKISKLIIEVPKNSFSLFLVFASADSVDFKEVFKQESELPVKGKYEFDCAFECRYIRILIQYNSNAPYAQLRNIEIFGCDGSEMPVKTENIYPEDFVNSKYNVDLTEQDTIAELHALVSRTVGEKYQDWFDFEIIKSDKEFFELCENSGKIRITANSGVNAAAGLNHYYKYFCFVHISQVGNNSKMPETPPKIHKPIRKETPFKIRYAYNYCALSYTMAFWNENDWQKELDWLALEGVNVILDITAQEEVWRRFLTKLGYSSLEAKAFITGPAYYAWFNMANIYGVGGPVHDGFFKKRTELARKNHLYMKKMGMMPVLQGYSGMVPKDIKEHVPNAPVIAQGKWNELERPYMLRTDSETYTRLADIFYESQCEVFGNYSNFFATDPFHEGGKSGRMKVQNVAKKIMASMLKNNKNSIWIIQSWGENPSKELINGLDGYKEHVLILDLYAEKRPRWENYLSREFMNTPWLYCMLNNFGGRMGLHGHLRTIAKEVARAAGQAKYMKGIGITPEATHSNPIAFDLFFETAWSDDSKLHEINLQEWFKGYITRRYGKFTENVYQAVLLLNETVYNPELNELGEGAPESVINARPALKIKSASTWGNSVIAYDKKVFEHAVALFVSDYDKLCQSEGYMFDLADLLKQVLSNTAQEYQINMSQAYQNKDLIEFMKYSDKFLDIIKYTDSVLSCQKEFLLGTWLKKADELAEEFDDFTKKMFRFNARALITTWAGSRLAADKGGLKDYSNKQWSGLTADFYYKRWKIWIENCKDELSGKKSEQIDWFRLENRWSWLENEYPSEPSDLSLKDAARQILSIYSVWNVS
ncbi:MAG: alpha-N-acetylglucosaminidase TIM-barrel domain-containing protein [Acutalibacteraceae bacterium]